jgi:hypothetical protein
VLEVFATAALKVCVPATWTVAVAGVTETAMLCGVVVLDPADPPPHPAVSTKISTNDKTNQQLRDRKARETMSGSSPEQMTWFPLEGEKPGFTVQEVGPGRGKSGLLKTNGFDTKSKGLDGLGLRTKRPQLAKESAHSFH